jgi:hypothetical protein
MERVVQVREKINFLFDTTELKEQRQLPIGV